MKIPIDTIIVSDDRHRKSFEGLDILAQSIQDVGLIHPVVVEKETSRLVAGERRLRACKLLGWKEIEVTFKEELDAWTLEMIQLEENLRRQNLTYPEEVEAKLRMHEKYQERFGGTVEGRKGGHRLVDTAEILGEAEGGVKMDIQLARAIRLRPELAEKETKSAAYKAMKSGEELSLRTQIAAILAADAPNDSPIQVILGDSLLKLKEYPDEFFDFCVTDPPYGVDVDDAHRLRFREKWSEIRVDDTRELSMQEEVFKEVYRVLREGAHCYVFFASGMQHETLGMLEGCGFIVRKIPLIWHKTKSLNLSAYTTFSSAFEPIFFCHKGTPKMFNFPGLEDVFTYDTPHAKVHPTEKPVDLIKKLVENCSVENELGLDPFAGSGTFGVACQELKRRAVLIEKDPEYYTVCWEKLGKEKNNVVA